MPETAAPESARSERELPPVQEDHGASEDSTSGPHEDALLDPAPSGWGSGRGLMILTLTLVVALVAVIVVAAVYWWTPGMDPIPVPTVSQA